MRVRTIGRLLLVTSVAGGLALAAGTAQAGDRELNHFSGRCDVSGVVNYPDRKLKTEQRSLHVVVRATGTCSGELDGEPVSKPVRIHAEKGRERFGCMPGGSLNDLPGDFNLEGRGNNIAIFLTSKNIGAVIPSTLEGSRGGTATGDVVITGSEPPNFAEACNEDGIRKFFFDAEYVADNLRG